MLKAISEKKLEQACIRIVKSMGGRAFKWSSPSQRGVPDRIIVLPEGKIVFMELKKQGAKPTQLQQYWIDFLKKIGANATWCDNKEDIEKYLRNL